MPEDLIRVVLVVHPYFVSYVKCGPPGKIAERDRVTGMFKSRSGEIKRAIEGQLSLLESRLKTPPAPSVAPGARCTLSRLNDSADSWFGIGLLSVCWTSGVTLSLVRLHSHV